MRLHFSLPALLLFASLLVLLSLALSAGSPAVHVGEAVSTVLILLGLTGVFRGVRERR
jgi:hypothetical protein